MTRLILLIALGLAAATDAAAQPTGAAKLFADGPGAYYNLPRQGFGGAVCKVSPDWTLTLGKPRSDPAMADAYAILDSLRFTLKLNAAGSATVDKVDPGAPRQGAAADGIAQIFTGMDQVFSGFFATWSLFMLHTPLPGAEAKPAVTAQAGGYHVTYKDADADVATEVGPGLAISRMEVRSAQFRSLILPRFGQSPQGMLLAGYTADYTPTTGPGRTHLEVTIDYQAVSGVQVPRRIGINSIYDGQPSKVALELSDCRVTQAVRR